MPLVPLSRLPDDARLWIFGSTRPLVPEQRARLFEAADDFLAGWRAHGTPLTAGRDLRRERFLWVAVDEATAPPSGCSIDALVGTLKGLEREMGTGLVDHAPVWYLEEDEVRCVSRPEFRRLAESGEVGPETVVYDTTVTRLGDARGGRWELEARESWHGRAFFGGARPAS